MNDITTAAGNLRLGIAGLGTIGLAVAKRVDAGEAGNMVVSAVSAVGASIVAPVVERSQPVRASDPATQDLNGDA